MDLAALLPELRHLPDLPRLIAALGLTPCWEELPGGGWLAGWGDRASAAPALVGRAGGFVWIGIEAGDPARAARAMARRLAAAGRVGGVMALAPGAEGRRLGVAVGFGEVPALECALEAADGRDLACLRRLAAVPEGGPLAYAASAAAALDGQAVGRAFFRAFRATLDRMAAALPPRASAAERHALALLQLTRVLFLYFVQSKGWLDGRPDFLARQVDRCLARGRRIHRDLLRPLFFGTLNRPPAERGRVPCELGRIPFLNGGLFEPHPLERRWPHDLPDRLWREAFDSLFERFHFTADESGRPGFIAPDMLGRVFEGVMEPEARRRSGTFYTPAALVGRLVRAALAAHLAEALGAGASEAERLLDQRSPAAGRALRGITILDPAVGSGAFLLGALELLAGFRRHRARAAAKRAVLRRNLFGVDLSPAAVRLTELRLWLAVIADDPGDRPDGVEPLPNLDCLVRQGDSLLDPLGGWPGPPPSQPASRELARLRAELVTAVGPAKRALARALRQAESRALGECLGATEAAIRRAIRECLGDARGRTLFGEPRGLDPPLRARLGRLRAELHRVRALRRQLERGGELPWFHYASQFADVFARGGFDLVVGNPPWVRSEELPPLLRRRLAERYRWWRSAPSRGFAHRPDLSLAFLERAWELARPGGSVALLVPAKLATAAYGARARHALASGGTLRVVADLTADPDASFDATTYPLALVATKRVAERPDHPVRTGLPPAEGPPVAQRELAGGGPWVLRPHPGDWALSAPLARDLPRLGDRLVSHLGVKTGANDLFLDPPPELEPELMRWAIRGRDVRPFHALARTRLLWPHDDRGRVLAELPPKARAYLAPAEARLRRRADYAGGPPWTLFRTGPAASPFRVVWADLARRLTALALADPALRDRIPLNTCYVIVAPSADAAHALAAWLNSTWIRAAARLVATPAAGGFARFGAQVVAGLPLPDAALGPELAELGRAGAAGRTVQSDLDEHAARLLELDAAARAALARVDAVGPDDRR